MRSEIGHEYHSEYLDCNIYSFPGNVNGVPCTFFSWSNRLRGKLYYEISGGFTSLEQVHESIRLWQTTRKAFSPQDFEAVRKFLNSTAEEQLQNLKFYPPNEAYLAEVNPALCPK